MTLVFELRTSEMKSAFEGRDSRVAADLFCISVFCVFHATGIRQAGGRSLKGSNGVLGV